LTTLGPEVLNQFLRTITANIQNILDEEKVHASVSYLGQGTFSLVIDEKKSMESFKESDNFKPAESIKEKIFRRFRKLFD
jgi:hypothetical protein